MKLIVCDILCSKSFLHIDILKRRQNFNKPLGVIHSYCTLVKKKDVNKMSAQINLNDVHSGWYEWWESKNFFRRTDSKERHVMLLPPPNITGKLHIGHALTVTVQDAICRWNTMNGRDVLWIPGIDHAGIATQTIVEKNLKVQGKKRQKMGRTKFIEEINIWKSQKEEEIYNQIRTIGGCLSWKNKYFTMDENLNHAVSEAFIRLFEKGLIYREKKIVHWSCSLNSVISDIEVEHINVRMPISLSVPGHKKAVEFGYMYHISYKLTDTGEKVTVGTTRPETILGDMALMVHPEDKKYTHLHGRKVYHPFRKEEIPILTSTSVLPDFGTGIMKITPGSSSVDFSMAKPYDLPTIDLIDINGRIIGFGEFEGMLRFEARQLILERLKEMDLFEGREAHQMTVPICSRTRDVMEEVVKDQWFLKLAQMNKRLSQAIEESRLTLSPSGTQAMLQQFLDGDVDWCISRQIWWGHRIPAYRAQVVDESREIYVAAHDEEQAKKKAAKEFGVNVAEVRLSRDEDVLDTWFSSSLLPFSTLGWPEETADLKKYFPNSIIETGFDIVYFWVARMAMMSEELMGSLPFKKVICHSLICDKFGAKMSKSKGNVIDPMDIIYGLEKKVEIEDKENVIKESKNQKGKNEHIQHGVDTLRLTLCSMNLDKTAVRYDEQFSLRCYKFQNKLWQSFHFMKTHAEAIPGASKLMRLPIYGRVDHIMDKWILTELADVVKNTNECFENYHISTAAHLCRNFWHLSFCDKYLTSVKCRVFNYENNLDAAQDALSVLWTCCNTYLRLMHPFMPFITEELYQQLPSTEDKHDSILQCHYPTSEVLNSFRNKNAKINAYTVFQTCEELRKLVKTLLLSKRVRATIIVHDPKMFELFSELRREIQDLAIYEDVQISNGNIGDFSKTKGNFIEPGNEYSVCLHLKGVIDPALQWDGTSQKISELTTMKTELSTKGNSLRNPKDQEKLNRILAYIALLEKALTVYEEMGT